MFGTIDAFTNQFTPIEGGYLYYPSGNGGGRFVSVEEYDRLVADWRRVAGPRAIWISAGLVVLPLMLWAMASTVLALPFWTSWIIIAACTAALLAWLLWAAYAPRRLVAARPVIAPPRPRGQARRQARAAIRWPMVILVLILSGAVFFTHLTLADRTSSWWAWVIGSGLMFGAYLWLGLQKLADRRR